jgi:hypothetical protein
MTVAFIMIVAGLLLVVVSVLAMMAAAPTLNRFVPIAIGAGLFVMGFVLLVTELMEAWLTRGQRALVDGLQAG